MKPQTTQTNLAEDGITEVRPITVVCSTLPQSQNYPFLMKIFYFLGKIKSEQKPTKSKNF